MPSTVEITTYAIGELEEHCGQSAYERALDTLRRWATDDPNFAEFIIEEFAEEMAAVGVNVEKRPVKLVGSVTRYEPDVYWSLYTQGSGASFEATVDLATWMRSQKIAGKYRALYNAAVAGSADAIIQRSSSNYVHEYTMSAEVRLDWDTIDRCESQARAVEELLTDWARDKAVGLHWTIEGEDQYRSSEEQLVEMAEANEYRFDEDGNLI